MGCGVECFRSKSLKRTQQTTCRLLCLWVQERALFWMGQGPLEMGIFFPKLQISTWRLDCLTVFLRSWPLEAPLVLGEGQG